MISALIVVGLLGAIAVLLRQRRDNIGNQGDVPRAWPMMAIPLIVGASNFGVSRAAALLLLLAIATAALGTYERQRVQRPLLLWLLLLAVAPVVMRGTAPDRMLLYVATALAILACVRRYRYESIVMSLIDGVALYLVLNVVAFEAGLRSPSAGGRTFGLVSSTGGERVFYPLTVSLPIPPLMAAMLVATAVGALWGAPWQRALRLAGLAASAWIMLSANTRVALIIAVLVGLGVFLWPRLVMRVAPLMAAASMALAFLYPLLVDAVLRPTISAVVSVVPQLSRGNVEGDISLEGRSTIWRAATTFWERHVPFTEALVGYGAQGQQVSGASATYAVSSDPSQSLRSLSTHNSLLQQLYDSGVIGALALLVVVYWTIAAQAARASGGSSYHLVGCAASLAAVLGGATEVALSPGYGTETFWMFFALAVATSMNSRASQHGEDRGRVTSRQVVGPRSRPRASWSGPAHAIADTAPPGE